MAENMELARNGERIVKGDSEIVIPVELQRSFTQMLSNSMEMAIQSVKQQDKMDNVAIFVDYDNVYWTLYNNYRHHPDHEDDDKNLFVKLWDFYGRDNVRIFKAYADFEQIKSDLTRLQKRRVQIRHVYANGKTEQGRKNASDIELSIDAIELTHTDPEITCYVIVTADSDMIPLMSRLMYKGKRVELFYIESALAKHTDLRNYAHISRDLITFLNVDTTPIDIRDKIAEAIVHIHNWHERYKESDITLGNKFLKNLFCDKMGLPSEAASRLIDLLKHEDIIREDTKVVSGAPRQTWVLNKMNSTVQDVLAQTQMYVAPTSE